MASPCDIGLAADARAHAARARSADAGLLGEAPHPAPLSLRAAFDASHGSASLRAPLAAASAGSTAPHGSPLSGRPLSRRRGTRTRAKPVAASLRARVPLSLTIPHARSADDLASRMWNARFTFVRTKPLRDVARTNHLAPAGVLADYRATRRVGSAAPLSPMRFGESKGLADLISQGLWFAAIADLLVGAACRAARAIRSASRLPVALHSVVHGAVHLAGRLHAQAFGDA